MIPSTRFPQKHGASSFHQISILGAVEWFQVVLLSFSVTKRARISVIYTDKLLVNVLG